MFANLFGNQPISVKRISMSILHFVFISKNALRKIGLVSLAVVFMGLGSSVFAQSKAIEKANELYKNNQFADAAVLYRQALTDMESEGKEARNATLIKSKLAYCYRMNNKMDKAEELYADVVKTDNAKAESFYYYGEALMSNGKYEEAKKWFKDYQKLEPTDEKTALMLRACDYAPTIKPYFQYLDIQEFAFNTEADDNAPIYTIRGLLFSSDRPQGGIKILKEKSGWTGRDYLNLYLSERMQDGSFAEPIQYSSKLSEVNKNTGNASLTADGAEIFFTRNDNELNKQNTYSLQLFSAKSGNTERWKDVEKLPFCSSNFNFMHPAVSPDGKLLFFATNRAGGFGGTDLWVSERKNGEWGKPENLGPAVNTTANEGFPFFSLDGKLYFCSKGHPGFGGFDVFVTYKDENGAWTPATNLGKPINSPLDDISIYVAADQKSGFFTSSRSGGDDDIYIFKVLDEAPATNPVEGPTVAELPTPIVPVEAPMPAPTEQAPVAEQTKIETQPLEPPAAVTPAAEAPTEEPALPTIEAMKPAEQAPVVAEHLPEATEKEAAVEMVKQEEPMPVIQEKTIPEPSEIKPTIQPELPVVQHLSSESNSIADVAQLGSFLDFSTKLDNSTLAVGEHFRLDGAVYDPVVWQLTPRITGPLDELIALLKKYPSLQIEISAHTESLGVDEDNLRITQNRASTVLDYILREGVSKGRVHAKGCGETMLLNNCRNGIICSMEEHLINQRLEVKVLALDGKF